MIQKIMVGLDHSDQSIKALQQAILLAQSCDAELKLVHVLMDSEAGAPQFGGYFGGPLYPSISAVAIESYQTAWNQFVERSQALLSQRVSEAGETGVNVSGSLLYGNPGAKLCQLAQTWQAELVIVGSRRLYGMGELLIGSVSNYVIHHAPCSVLIVHGDKSALPLSIQGDGEHRPLEPVEKPRRILVPVDKSDMAKGAMQTAFTLAKQYQAEVRLVHIIDDDEAGMPQRLIFSDSQYIMQHSEHLFTEYKQQWNHFVNDWWQRLQSYVEEMEKAGVDVICDVMQGRTGPRICELAEDWQADLVVMGRRGFTGLKELVVGSVSYYVSHRAPCSVLIARSVRSQQHPLPIKQDTRRIVQSVR